MSNYNGMEIAIIGMSGRFPGANTINEFWKNLQSGKEAITFFTDEELAKEGISKEQLKDPNYIKAASLLEGKEYFDSGFFGYIPSEAGLMDPQIRKFHEVCWHALEDAGYDFQNKKSTVGLFAGGATNNNWENYAMLANSESQLDGYTVSNLSDITFLCSRVSYLLNLKGPSLYINTACSTSLVAVQKACMSLLLRECEIALAGGVSIGNKGKEGYRYQPGMIYSKDGHCRAFDAEASGTIGGEGAGVVVLKRLKDAIADGDHIYAVIKGSGVNNDGNDKVSFNAPGVDGQSQAIRKALKMSGVDPKSISYVEAHGTGTDLGDPIEVQALTKAFGKSDKPYCALGTLKSNMGHLNTAAGVAGLMKTVLSIKNRQLPPSLHFNTPNPKINFKDSPFYVNAELKNWELPGENPLRAGVSSFGIGGTNAHVILEEAPKQKPSSPGRKHKTLMFSAKSPAALKNNVKNFTTFLEDNKQLNLADAAYTLQTGRAEFDYRKTLSFESTEELLNLLNSKEFNRYPEKPTVKKTPEVVFMFSGQGSQYPQMGLNLYKSETYFKNQVDQCLAIAAKHTNADLKSALFSNADEANENINATVITQPCLFIIEYALAKTLMHWGVTPSRLIGHSIGEFVAAAISGVFNLEDAIKLVVKRGELMQKLPQGAMLAVSLSETELKPFLNTHSQVDLAASNSSKLCTVSGTNEAIASFEEELNAAGHQVKPIRTSHAFHSYMMEPVLEEFAREIEKIEINTSSVPVISNLTGKPVNGDEICKPEYWVNHLRNTVRFADGIETILGNDDAVLIEVGPGRALCSLVRSNAAKKRNHSVIQLMRHPKQLIEDSFILAEALGKIWETGVKINWENFYENESRYKISLPGYAFEKIEYPVNVNAIQMVQDYIKNNTTSINENSNDWFYVPSWKMALRSNGVAPSTKGKSLMVFGKNELTEKLYTNLENLFAGVLTVTVGAAFKKCSEKSFEVDPFDKETVSELFHTLKKENTLPDFVLYQTEKSSGNSDFYLLKDLMEYWQEAAPAKEKHISLLTDSLCHVTGYEKANSQAAKIASLLRVISQEYPTVTASQLDILPEEISNETSYKEICMEIAKSGNRPAIALRKGQKWEQFFDKYQLPEQKTSIRKGGVYLITGGLGNLGYTLSTYLQQTYNAKLIVIGRSQLPEAPNGGTGDNSEIYQKLSKLNNLKAKGEVIYITANVADKNQLAAAVAKADQEFGTINGIFHAANINTADTLETLKTLNQLTNQDFKEQFEPKEAGLDALKQVCENRNIDFCVVTSSVATILGGLGYGAYAPANAYMDHFVDLQTTNNTTSNRWLSINLDGINFDGDNKNDAALKPEDLGPLFDSIVSNNQFNRLIVSKSDFYERYKTWILNPTGNTTEKIADATNNEELEINEDSISKTNSPEYKLLTLWKKFFGKSDIEVYDDFFEIGGDSLKALSMIGILNKTFGITISVKEFFNNANIEKLISFMNKSGNAVNGTEGYYAIPKAENKPFYPLSSAQKRLYFLYQMNPGSLEYNIPQTIELSDTITSKTVENTFRKLAERHESLRTSFKIEEGEPVQQISNEIKVSFEYQRLSDEKAEEFANSFFKRPFNLEEGPLFRTAVVDTDSKKVLLLNMHHIITDAVSNEILVDEFNTFLLGKDFETVARPYRDYSEWQNSPTQQEAILKDQDYWLGALKNYGTLNLPVDYQRGKHMSDKGAVVGRFVTTAELEILDRYCSKFSMTRSMLVFALYNLVLSRVSLQEDFVTGLSIAGRNHPDLEKIVGMFVNALPLRILPEQEKTLSVFLEEIRETTLNAMQHQYCQFDTLVEKLGVQRESGRNPIFDVMFNFEGSVNSNAEIDHPDAFKFVHTDFTKRFDLTLNMVEFKNTLRLNLQYDTALFAPETAEEILRFIFNILANLDGREERKLKEIELVPNAVVQNVFEELNDYSNYKNTGEEYLDASSHQERMWFIDRFESGYLYEKGPVYHNIPLILDFNGAPDTKLIEDSFRLLLKKYEILCTSIITQDERPYQKTNLALVDSFRLKEKEVAPAEVYQTILTETFRPFELNEPLLRAVFLKTGDTNGKFVAVIHHAIADRFTIRLLERELLETYKLLGKGEKPGQVSTQPDYVAFTAWQEQSLAKLERHLVLKWKEQLGQKVKALEFPTDRPRVPIHIYKASFSEILIDDEITGKLEDHVERTGISEQVLLMAAFKCLLYKYAQHEEIVIGTSLSNRKHKAFRDLAGPVSNLVVLKTLINPNADFNVLAKQLSNSFNIAFENQAMSFDRLVKALAPEKDMSRTALFDVLFEYEPNEQNFPEINGLNVASEDLNLGYGKYDLNLFLRKEKGTITGNLTFNEEYFDKETASQIIGHFKTVLNQILSKPSITIEEIELVSKEEMAATQVMLNREKVVFPKEETIISLFAEQVKKYPEKIAVKYNERELTYQELDKLSSEIASLLISKGIKQETIVGLFTERSLETVIGILGILKAGGAYLPIDTQYPEDRIGYIISDSKTPLILTTDALREKLSGYETSLITFEEAASREKADKDLEITISPESLCYIIYTSGTTGKPKGVMIEHRNVVRLFVNEEFQFDFGADDIWTMFHSHCFDFSVWEMYGALLFGGKLIIIPKSKAKDARSYLEILEKEKVTILNQTPSAFYNLIDTEKMTGRKQLSAIRYVIFGGEALRPGMLKEWHSEYPEAKLVNMYGITETTVHVTYKEIGTYEVENNSGNIGKPIPTLSILLLDEKLRPVPRGVTGEIYVGGKGVSRGYLNKRELTAARFIENPFNAGERLYRSGDLARMLTNGDLEYIGRIDKQVQLRGFRIELGEIEAQLQAYENISECAVILREQDTDKQLLAYYKANVTVDSNKLRNFLADRLPDYMIPNFYIRLDEIPLTINGKLDRDSLPEPEIKATKEFIAPETETEIKLAGIWSEVLKLEMSSISADASFFDIGGHSLRATVLVNKILKEFDVEIALKEVFVNPTIQSMAQFIDTSLWVLKDSEKTNELKREILI